MYVIFEDRSIQYKVKEGDEILIQRLESDSKDLEFDKVLLISEGEQSLIGQPYVKGAKVKATVVEQLRDKKIVVFKYKRKTGYHNKNGHRQPVTLIKIGQIQKA